MTFICCVLFVMVLFRLIGFALKLGWGIMKVALYIVFFPGIILAMIFGGMFFIALPVLIIAGIVSAAVRV
ncbi:MAG: hypothetical protein K6G58_06855 [Lachnospiraceae bacterium]|nr:hypothetical protein [Lachnospiraceae bacterium]